MRLNMLNPRTWFRSADRGYVDLGNGMSGYADFIYSSYGTPDRERMVPTFMSFATSGYQNNPVVFGVILARMMLFTEATFKWQRLDTKKLFGNSDLELLEYPWPNGTTGELLARMEQDASLAGNTFIRKGPDRLERLRPDCVTIVSQIVRDSFGEQVREVVGYWYDPSGFDTEREPTMYSVEEICHWSPIPDPIAGFRGMSWLTPVIREITADSGMTMYKTQYLQHAATPNLFIKYDRELSDEAARKVGAAVQAKHGGVGNAFGTLILDKGADVTVLGADFKSLDFSNVQAAGENRIAVAAGVPGIVAGLKEGLAAATYSNYEQAMRRFADLTMRPLWRSACAALESLVVVPAGCRLWFDTSDIAALRQGEKDRADTFLVKSTTAETLIRAGFDPNTVAAAIDSGDMTQLKHTGRIPTALYNTNDPVDPAFPKSEKLAEPPIPVASPDPNAPKAIPAKAAT